MWHQVEAWKAGHKRECNRPSVLTREQTQSRGTVAVLENEALALAREVRGVDPGFAGNIYSLLGCAFYENGDYGRAREIYEYDRAILEAQGDRAGVARACGNIGNCYYRTKDYEQARVLYEQRRAVAEALGDRAGVARACGDLANCYFNTGDCGRARELHEEVGKICEALGDRNGLAVACCHIGICYYYADDYGRAREQHEKCRTICEAQGDRAGMARACCNMGNCYQCTGEYARAIELHEQDMAMCEALGDRSGVASACGNLGLCYENTGDYGRARELFEQHSAMAKTLGDRLGMARACGNLGDCCLKTGEYARAISYFTEQYDMAKDMQGKPDQADAALGMGVALRLEVRANVRGRAAGTSELPGPRTFSSACSENGVREAEKWLQTALDLGRHAARLHLARLTFDAGLEDTALAHLQGYLSCYVQNGRNRCAGCEQIRAKDTQMLTCGGCRVARFCSADHQKMASKSVAVGGSLFEGRHRDVCDVLGKWRVQVVKHGMSPDVLRSDLLACLRQ